MNRRLARCRPTVGPAVGTPACTARFVPLFKRFCLCCLMLSLSGLLRAQRGGEDVPLWLESRAELLAEEEQRDWEEELTDLSDRRRHPLDLNRATRQQLADFPFLTEAQVENLLAYIYVHGAMETLYELQLVEGMDRQTIELLLPFVCVGAAEDTGRFPKLGEIGKRGRHEVLARMDFPFYDRKGYEKEYLGPSQYHSLRYTFRCGDYVQLGVSGEKDAGEPWGALHNKKGYDSYSFYLQVRELGRLKTLVAGNYKLDFGQGLVLGSGFYTGKGFSLNTTGHRATGVRRHGSTDEYNYLRGIAGTLSLTSRLELSAFYSHRSMDGTVKEDTITSISKTGLHRTQKEADKRNAFVMQLAGGNLTYTGRRLRVGATGIYYFLDKPYEPSLQKYAKYNLHGSRFYNVGLDYRWSLGRFSLSGEAAKGTEGYALLNRLGYAFSADCRLALIHRYYAHDYWAFYARAFGEGSTPQNENGWYLAAEATPFARWCLFASVDLFSFPWWKYRISKPSQGVDGMFQASYEPGRSVSMLLNYRFKRKERDVTGTGGSVTLPVCHHRLRYRISYTSGGWTLRATADYNNFRQQEREASQGWQVVQACAFRFARFPLSVSLQGSYFHTDDYDSRVYAYENGLLYAFYTPSYYGRGFRYSARVQCDWGRHLTLLCKAGQTLYRDRESIGSGNDLIASNRKTDLQVQLRVRF